MALPQKVNTQQELPTGAPKRRSRIGASVSCQVHHKNFGPILNKNIDKTYPPTYAQSIMSSIIIFYI